jgi:hypothetical protein
MSTHHSREKRDVAVPCVRCRKPTFEFDRRCEPCTVAASTPADESTYYQFDLDTQRVQVPEFRLNPNDVRNEILSALAN